MRIIDFRLRRTHTQFFQKGSKLFFIEKLLALLFLTLCIVLLKHAMEIDARARGKKWWTIVVEWQSAIGNMRILKSCEGTSKINEPKVNVSVVFFSSSVMERFFSGVFQITKNLLLIWRYNWLTPEPEPEPEWNVITQMLFGKLKCNEKKQEYPHTHTLESGQMVIESGIQMRCSYQIVLCDLLASWGHFEQKHFGSMFSNATPSRSQNTL